MVSKRNQIIQKLLREKISMSYEIIYELKVGRF